MANEALNIGDSLYRYVVLGGIFHYIVIGKREYADDVQYEVECQTCNHGYKCVVLVAYDDYGRLMTVRALSDDDGERQYAWHVNDDNGLHYRRTKEEAGQDYFNYRIKVADTEIAKAQQTIERCEKTKAELQTFLEKCNG